MCGGGWRRLWRRELTRNGGLGVGGGGVVEYSEEHEDGSGVDVGGM